MGESYWGFTATSHKQFRGQLFRDGPVVWRKGWSGGGVDGKIERAVPIAWRWTVVKAP